VRELGCLQLDPISAVARSHLLVLWSRLGAYDPADLDALLWEEKRFFEYWAHCASIVLTEDYPIHSEMMRRYAGDESEWAQRTRDWMRENQALHDHVLGEIRARGPLLSRQLEDRRETDWESTGWTSGRNVSRMLDFLWIRGKLMVAGRTGGQKLWDLAERFLPEWTPHEELSRHEMVCRAAQRSLRALGVARPAHIGQHFIRGRYPGLARVLRELEKEGRIERVEINDNGHAWPGPWYVHTEDVPLLERLAAGEWEPRTTLLSPFDNLICDRKRTEELFGFRFRIEIYVPKEQREYGYYVLPILHGDRLVGRIDPTMNRKAKTLEVNAVYSEDTPIAGEVAEATRQAVEGLASFLGAKEVVYGERVPAGWRG
jgi:hypothetical protein